MSSWSPSGPAPELGELALKIDVDTLRGTLEGVPRLAAALRAAGAAATFLFSLGPDHTGRALRRVFRRGFLGKVARTSVLEHYGVKTLMYGTLLPGPDIGRRAGAAMRAVAEAGFEVGVHCHDHVLWQDFVARRGAEWTARQMRLAADAFAAVFGFRAPVHGAAGWQMNDAAFRLEEELGYRCASDTRGDGPFRPLVDGRPGAVPQFPTTLPTLDELLGRDGLTAANVDAEILGRTATSRPCEVFTLHAELEGQRLLPVFLRLLDGWRRQGHELVSLGRLRAGVNVGTLPCRTVVRGTVPGRSGTLALQGPPPAASVA